MCTVFDRFLSDANILILYKKGPFQLSNVTTLYYKLIIFSAEIHCIAFLIKCSKEVYYKYMC